MLTFNSSPHLFMLKRLVLVSTLCTGTAVAQDLMMRSLVDNGTVEIVVETTSIEINPNFSKLPVTGEASGSAAMALAEAVRAR